MAELDESFGLHSRIALLARNPLLGKLDPGLIAKLAPFTHVRPMKKGEVVFRTGDAGTGMMAVIQGRVRISLPSDEGREIVLNVIRAGEVFGEIALLDGRPRTADATALTDGKLLVLERREMRPLVLNSPELSMALIDVLCERLRNTSSQVAELIFHELPRRLAKLLLRLAPGEGGWINVTQRELGEMAGAARESVNRRVKEWEAEGLIELKPSAVRVKDRRALEDLAATDPGLD